MLTVAMKPANAEHRPSSLLSRDENSQLETLLGAKCQSLATSVVQLFLTETPDHGQWRRKDAGVLCFVKDNIRRSYFFRLYCLSRRSLVWEQQVYNEMEYKAPRKWMHTFEAEHAMAAFNFASEDEAEKFRYVVNNQLEAKRQRRAERRSRASLGHNEAVQSSMPNLQSTAAPTFNGPSINKHHRSTSSGGASKRKDKEGKRRLRKEDIGLPQNFRHVSHVGWDPNKGFDVELDSIQEPQWKIFFDKAGVSETQLRDRETREFIYQFIQSNGGLDAVKEDVVVPAAPMRAPPVPSRATPTPSNHTPYKPSPPPPPSLAQPRVCPPTPVSQQRSAPPPPPPSMTSKPSYNQERNAAPAPPPPPPPPMADNVVAPPPLPPAPALSSTNETRSTNEARFAPDPRSALMDAIKSGSKTLKHVEVEKKPVAASDSRGELLDQIRQGAKLKSVQPNERPTGPSVPADGLAGALARALADRNRAFHNDSDTESDNDSDTDSEWEE